MKDYKTYLPHHRDRRERLMDGVCYLLSGLLLAGLIGTTMHGCVEAVVMEAELREQYEPPPVYVQQTYQRPAAYRLQYPTADQMDHLDGMLRVMEVRR